MQRYAASDHSEAKPRTRDVGKEREGWMLRKEAVSGVLLAKGPLVSRTSKNSPVSPLYDMYSTVNSPIASRIGTIRESA